MTREQHGPADALRRRRRRPAGAEPGAVATEAYEAIATWADVVAAYHLLLDREPDPEGAAFYQARISAGMLRRELAAELINSTEFARRFPHLFDEYPTDTAVIETAEFSIVVEPHDWAVGGTIARAHDYERDVSAVVRSILRPGGVFVDVGANVGWYSLLGASLAGPGGHVLAVEPNPRNVRLLEASRAKNGFDQITIFAGAAYDTDTWLALGTDGSNGNVLSLDLATPRSSRPVPCSYVVPATTLDGLLRERSLTTEVDLVKIDVEGVEARVIDGARELLEQQHPPILMEWYPDAIRRAGASDPSLPLEMLRRQGYVLSVVTSAMDDQVTMSNDELEAWRVAAGSDLLDLLAVWPG